MRRPISSLQPRLYEARVAELQRVVDRRTGRTLERRLITRNHALVKYPVPDALVEVADSPSAAAPAC